MAWGVIALLMAGAAAAQDTTYTRGEYHFTVAPQPAFVQVEQIPAQWGTAAPGADDNRWRVWRYDEQLDRRANQDVLFVDYAYETRTAANVGEAGRYDITFNPEYQSLAIHRVDIRRDGRWQSRLVPERISLARREAEFEQDQADGNVTALIVLEDVRVGDIVRMQYSIRGSNPILAGQMVDGAQFAWGSPVLDRRLRVLYDPATQVTVRRENGAPEADIRRGADATEVSVRAHGVRAWNDEGSYPAWYTPFPMVEVAAQRSWADVVAWALPLYGPSELPPELVARAGKWASLPDDSARLTAALRLVQDEVRYFGVEMGENTHRPNPPALTWSRRYGDCKDKVTLLVALLRQLGIPADPALVSVADGRGIAAAPPGASLFDHVIVRAQLGGNVVWVDPTISDQGGSARDSDLSEYGMALPIRAGVTAPETIRAGSARGEMKVTEGFELLPDGKRARLKVLTRYEGMAADRARGTVGTRRIDEISRQYAEYYRRRFGELDVVAEPVVEDDRERNVIEVTESYLLKSPYEATGSDRLLDVFGETMSSISQLPESLERVAPLQFGQPMHLRHEVDVRLPERWTTELGDEDEAYESPAFKYRRDLTVADRQIKLVYDMDVTAADVAADKVGQHLGELRKLRDSLSARLHVRVPGSASQETSREERLKSLLKDVMDDK